MNSVKDCKIIELETRHSEKGNLTVIENQETVQFEVERLYYLYDVPGGEERGGHAHKTLWQLLVAGSGSFDVIIDDGTEKMKFSLNRSYYGLLIVPGIWRDIKNFSSGSVCLVLASQKYAESDYIREYTDFLKYKRSCK